jgi:hypothetical protein
MPLIVELSPTSKLLGPTFAKASALELNKRPMKDSRKLSKIALNKEHQYLMRNFLNSIVNPNALHLKNSKKQLLVMYQRASLLNSRIK